MMQPVTAESDPQYIGIRRILLPRKSESGAISRRYVSSLSLSLSLFNLSLQTLNASPHLQETFPPSFPC
uniref:Uncharacterized protein n=1 Tax=Brassica campestris TaxID=3711 RepID=A0A3P6B8L4_BRACM|nr:unnamed protein product [Brassica rapa]